MARSALLKLARNQSMSLNISQLQPPRAFYTAPIESFLQSNTNSILGEVTRNSGYSIETTQRDAWVSQIDILQSQLQHYSGRGSIFLEFVIPRLGKRIDALAVIDHVIFVIEFKVGNSSFHRHAIDQVWDYALDLKYFHEPSHACAIAPILVATGTNDTFGKVSTTHHNDGVLIPINTSPNHLSSVIEAALKFTEGEKLDVEGWLNGRYCPTPTIIEAASALYGSHSVENLSRSDAGEKNLARTSGAISRLIQKAKEDGKKAICFVTGVPGAGKTLVGLDIATKHMDAKNDLHSVYLSGNGPLVSILREALARDEIARNESAGKKIRKGEARKAVEAFIQNVHHFRDAYLTDRTPPAD